MNSLIDEINSYPFERLRNLIIPTKNKNEINLSIGEPKLPIGDTKFSIGEPSQV